jgi:hypothetical protein
MSFTTDVHQRRIVEAVYVTALLAPHLSTAKLVADC